jgi:hypothetical protein
MALSISDRASSTVEPKKFPARWSVKSPLSSALTGLRYAPPITVTSKLPPLGAQERALIAKNGPDAGLGGDIALLGHFRKHARKPLAELRVARRSVPSAGSIATVRGPYDGMSPSGVRSPGVVFAPAGS